MTDRNVNDRKLLLFKDNNKTNDNSIKRHNTNNYANNNTTISLFHIYRPVKRSYISDLDIKLTNVQYLNTQNNNEDAYKALVSKFVTKNSKSNTLYGL